MILFFLKTSGWPQLGKISLLKLDENWAWGNIIIDYAGQLSLLESFRYVSKWNCLGIFDFKLMMFLDVCFKQMGDSVKVPSICGPRRCVFLCWCVVVEFLFTSWKGLHSGVTGCHWSIQSCIVSTWLGGGFKYVLFSPVLGEDEPFFDEHIFSDRLVKNHQAPMRSWIF